MAQSQPRPQPADRAVWFITGCSTGFGRALALHALRRGHRVVVTARHAEQVADLAQAGEALVLTLDVTQQSQVDVAVQAALAHFGHIDVLVNNAGIGYLAAIEESEESEVRKMFDVNVFGLSRMTQAVLPAMRERRQGFIVNFSSIAGLRAVPSIGFYSATKFAVEGLSEALSQELEPLGIKVMLIEPSGFRTDWGGRSANESPHQIADYASTAGAHRLHLREVSGKQPGDPALAARAIVNAVESPHPPHRLLLGNTAFDGAMAKLNEMRADFAPWEVVSRGVDAPSSS